MPSFCFKKGKKVNLSAVHKELFQEVPLTRIKLNCLLSLTCLPLHDYHPLNNCPFCCPFHAYSPMSSFPCITLLQLIYPHFLAPFPSSLPFKSKPNIYSPPSDSPCYSTIIQAIFPPEDDEEPAP